jgi:hypothetical protein
MLLRNSILWLFSLPPWPPLQHRRPGLLHPFPGHPRVAPGPFPSQSPPPSLERSSALCVDGVRRESLRKERYAVVLAGTMTWLRQRSSRKNYKKKEEASGQTTR